MNQKTPFVYTQSTYRKWCVIKYPLLVTVLTFVAIKLLIVHELDDWTRDTPRDVSLYIFPEANSTLIFPQKLEKHYADRLDVLVIVASDPQRQDRRNSIRQTWGKVETNAGADVKMSLVFLVGLHGDPEVNRRIVEESELFGDLLVENFRESYLNLTVKSLMLVKFAALTDVDADFVFKVDDDTYLNVPRLSELVKSSKLDNVISGRLNNQTKPIRWSYRFNKVESRWICPKWTYPEEKFPFYINGLGYIFPKSMAPCLFKMSLVTPLVPIEDLFVTGILASKCGFPIQHLDGFHTKRVDLCNSSVEVVLAHNIFPDEQRFVHQLVTKRSVENCTWNVKRRH